MKPKNNLTRIYPKMVTISNNSQITQMMANRFVEKLSPEEFMLLDRWLQIALDQIPTGKDHRYI